MITLAIFKRFGREALIILLFVVIAFQQTCSGDYDPPVADTVIVTIPEYQPPVIRTDTMYLDKIIKGEHVVRTDTIIKWNTVTESYDIDSLAVVKDWLTLRVYNDTIMDNEVALIVINDEIRENKIMNRIPEIMIYPKINTVSEKRTKFFGGFGASGWSDKFGVHGSIALLTKRDHLYSLSYDPFNQSISLTFFWKLSFRKKKNR